MPDENRLAEQTCVLCGEPFFVGQYAIEALSGLAHVCCDDSECETPAGAVRITE